MIRLRDEQWERIRDHFPEEKIADGCPGHGRFRDIGSVEVLGVGFRHCALSRPKCPRSCFDGPQFEVKRPGAADSLWMTPMAHCAVRSRRQQAVSVSRP